MRWGRHLAILLAIGCLVAAASASAGPRGTRVVHRPGKIVPIPASVPHEPGDMIDRRIVPNLRWLAARFPIYVTDGYSGPLPGGGWAGCRGCHVRRSDHHNGLAVDIVPRRWSARCNRNWRGITRLARWAEPRQNHPLAPFRWVGYQGDAHHGCGDHLHLSWSHSPARRFRLAASVEVFRVPPRIGAGRPASNQPPPGVRDGQVTAEPPPSFENGGTSYSAAQSGGISANG